MIILDGNSGVFMANIGKDTKHTRHISRRVHFARNDENVNCTRLTDVKEDCNRQKLKLRMFEIMI